MTDESEMDRPSNIVLAPPQGLPKGHVLSRMHDQLQSGKLSARARWELSKQYNAALKAWFQDQIDKSLIVAQAGTNAAANARLKEITQYANQYTLELRSRYIATMASLGLRVETEQMNFAIAAAERLTADLERVAAAKITEPYRERLIAMVNNSFDRLVGGLNTLNEDLLKNASRMDAP